MQDPTRREATKFILYRALRTKRGIDVYTMHYAFRGSNLCNCDDSNHCDLSNSGTLLFAFLVSKKQLTSYLA
jgi:hypothetical protein